ncbi:MAG: WYL domain-containing protein [Candidatus Hydrogenedentes bacterium]|jgi:predicted DNA-binding transcriptional regulator YafY|nr:WYL domain-containing protein [Candidatus Hydrogenedentota bacterium]
MQKKKDPYASSAQKVIGLYGLLLFTGRPYSLTQLSQLFRCSKQTILRMVEQIERSQRIQIEAWIEKGRKWYRVRTPKQRPNVALSVDDIQRLLLCRDMTLQIFPEALRKRISETIETTTVLLSDYDERESALASFTQPQPKGIVDYSDFGHILDALLKAIRERCICTVLYRSPEWSEPRSLTVAPYLFISFREGFYAKCREESDLRKKKHARDRTLAVHRMIELVPTDRRFPPIEIKDDGSADAFGLAREKAFPVVVDIVPKAAMYVRERIWSKDQRITEHQDGGLTLEFTATSKPEVLAWVLSFGGEATLREPTALRSELLSRLKTMMESHTDMM